MIRQFTAKLLTLGLAIAWLGLGASCVSPKEILYLQDAEPNTSELIKGYSQPTIQKDDRLSITVSSKHPELTEPFNVKELGSQGSSSSGTGGHLVNANGDIVLPIIGRIHAAGKTCTQLAADIAATLRDSGYLNDASVDVHISNFKYYTIGEVGTGMHTVDGQRITILEAIAQAGDLNLGGDRTVRVVREIDGKRHYATIDLRSKDLFNSPYYYIKQNDVIYVTQADHVINARKDVAQYWSWGVTGLTFIISMVALFSA